MINYNIDLLKFKKNVNIMTFDNIMSLGFHPKISLPTRLGNNNNLYFVLYVHT